MKGKVKGKIKGSFYAALIVSMVACFLNGCTGTDEIPPASSVGESTVEAGKQAEAEVSQSSNGNTAGRIEPAYLDEMIEALDEEECPEGYVYDYQVSMEPIPEEIAVLGGPCQGTIHAFPSKIGMALTELEMEKNPVLKAEVEKRIPEIEAALEEEIGGDFTVDGVICSNEERTWIFICTEVETGYSFDLYYANSDYYDYINGGTWLDLNILNVIDYYREKESIELREDLNPIIAELWQDGEWKIQTQLRGTPVIDIVIAEYTEGEIDKIQEQEKILLLWDSLQAYNDEVHYNISLTFYYPEYKELISEKYSSNIRYDFGKIFNEKLVNCLGNNSEIIGCFEYASEIEERKEQNLSILLQQYVVGEYCEETIWEYWTY